MGRRRVDVVRISALLIGLLGQNDQPGPLKGTVAAGVTVAHVQPASDTLSPRTRVRPALRRLPAQGFGVAFAFNWFESEIDETFASTDVPFGRLALRPVMAGIGYTAVRGRASVSPSIVVGPALATIGIDDRLQDRFVVTGNGFERHVGRVTVATRAGVSATYALAPRLGLTGSAGYLWSRPSFTLATPAGFVRKVVRADSLVLDGGIVVSLF